MTNRRRILAIVSAGSLAIFLAACGSDDSATAVPGDGGTTGDTGTPDVTVDARNDGATSGDAAKDAPKDAPADSGTDSGVDAGTDAGTDANAGDAGSDASVDAGSDASDAGCTPTTSCPVGQNCGTAPDGCGGTINCGTCTAPQICGGGGTPNVCGIGPCVPTTSCPVGQNCGTAPNGCGGTINCGTCTAPQTCGGGGTLNTCGCTPATVCPGGQNCGTAANGCGGTLTCGTCTAPQTCGGGGLPNTCGCTPATSCPVGQNCGTAPNGCGGTLACGTCTAPQTCGGGGTLNTCGCTPATVCPGGQNCGTAPNGCGGTLACGTCTAPQTCGGGGTPNVCGSAVCGNAIRESGEQCDDGNLVNLDGCSATCLFEQSTRATTIKMQFATDAYCTANALGSAFTTNAQGQLQTAIDTNVTSGVVSFLLTYVTIPDLTGTNGPAELGSVTGVPTSTVGYNGNADLDWWYAVDAVTLSPSRVPTAKHLVGAFAGSVLDAGPGHLWLAITGIANLDLGGSKIRLPIGTSTVPLTSAGTPPGHVAAEHLDPVLQSFATAGGLNAAPTGQLCGNATADSLAKAPVPAALQVGGANACNENYTAANSMLDVLVGGCKVFFGLVTVINKTQPDASDPDAPIAGAGAPYTLTENAAKVVTACTDSSATAVPLASCLRAAAYSSSFKMTVDRVILK